MTNTERHTESLYLLVHRVVENSQRVNRDPMTGIYGMLVGKPYLLNQRVANVIMALSTKSFSRLPQPSPSSPVIAQAWWLPTLDGRACPSVWLKAVQVHQVSLTTIRSGQCNETEKTAHKTLDTLMHVAQAKWSYVDKRVQTSLNAMGSGSMKGRAEVSESVDSPTLHQELGESTVFLSLLRRIIPVYVSPEIFEGALTQETVGRMLLRVSGHDREPTPLKRTKYGTGPCHTSSEPLGI